MIRLLRRCCLLLFGLLGAGLLLAAPAAAHATVVSSDPADGTRLNAVPTTVAITFDESVGLGGIGYVNVTDQAGRRDDSGRAFHPAGDGAKVALRLRSGLGDGTYTVSFRVVSADSHPVAGTIRFVVGAGALAHGTLAGSAADRTTSAAFDVVRWLSYAGLALLGGAWLLLTVWPAGRDDRRARRLVWSGWGLAVVGGVLELLLEGPYAAGLGLSGVSASLTDATLHTDYGLLHCIRLVLLGGLALLFGRALQPERIPASAAPVAGLLGLGVAATFAASGHGASTSPSWVSVPLDALHVSAMGVWLGGLIMLVAAVLPRREPDELDHVLPVFSRVAFAAVVVLALSGTYAAWRGIDRLDAIFGTTYGLLVVAKVVLFVGLLALASLSRRVVRRRTVAYAMTDAALLDEADDADPDFDAGPDDVEHERLRRSVYVEALIGLVVLGFSAVLVAQPRGPEALAAADREPVSATAPLGSGRSVTVRVEPGTHGPVDLTLTLNGTVRASGITATATQKSAQIGPLPVTLVRRGDAAYDGTVTLPVAGKWEIDLVVTSSTYDATTTDVTLELH